MRTLTHIQAPVWFQEEIAAQKSPKMFQRGQKIDLFDVEKMVCKNVQKRVCEHFKFLETVSPSSSFCIQDECWSKTLWNIYFRELSKLYNLYICVYLAPEFLLQIRLSDTEFHSNATRMANRNSLGFGMVHCMQLLGFFGNKVLLRISNVPMMRSSSKGSSRALCPGN